MPRLLGGSPEYSGLMKLLYVVGESQRVLSEVTDTQFNRLFRRKFTIRSITNISGGLRVETDVGPVMVLVFVMHRESRQFAGDLTREEVADVLA